MHDLEIFSNKQSDLVIRVLIWNYQSNLTLLFENLVIYFRKVILLTLQFIYNVAVLVKSVINEICHVTDFCSCISILLEKKEADSISLTL